MKAPLLCRLGWHTNTYRDSAFFCSADRCNRCGEWVDETEGAKVDFERKTWEMADKYRKSKEQS